MNTNVCKVFPHAVRCFMLWRGSTNIFIFFLKLHNWTPFRIYTTLFVFLFFWMSFSVWMKAEDWSTWCDNIHHFYEGCCFFPCFYLKLWMKYYWERLYEIMCVCETIIFCDNGDGWCFITIIMWWKVAQIWCL